VRAGFEAFDLQRQINEYEAAHPKIDGEPGKLIPEPEALQDLRAALAGKQATVRTEQGKQHAIVLATVTAAGETLDPDKWSYQRIIDIATGEIVLGRNPEMTKHDEVVLQPGEAGADGKGDGKVVK
jgi:hypothetical protein